MSISVMLGLARICAPTCATTRAMALTSTAAAPRMPCSMTAALRRVSSTRMSSSAMSAGIRRTSLSASIQIPPKPTSTTGPQSSSRLAPTTSSKPHGPMASTSAPSSTSSGRWCLTLANSFSHPARSAASSAKPTSTPPTSLLCGSSLACALSTTGKPIRWAILTA